MLMILMTTLTSMTLMNPTCPMTGIALGICGSCNSRLTFRRLEEIIENLFAEKYQDFVSII
jgi:hypothetical protein